MNTDKHGYKMKYILYLLSLTNFTNNIHYLFRLDISIYAVNLKRRAIRIQRLNYKI